MSGSSFFYLGISLAAAAFASFVFICLRKRRGNIGTFMPDFTSVDEEVDEFSFSDIVTYFRDEERLTKLKSNKNYRPIVMKKLNGTRVKLCMCIFDMKESKVVAPHIYTIEAKSLHEDVLKHFGQKDMIVLQ